MSQNIVDFTVDPSGDQLLDNLLKPQQDNLLTMNMGTSRPPYAQIGTPWLDNTSTPWIYKIFMGTNDIIMGQVDPTTLKFTPSTVTPGTPIIGAGGTVDAITATYVPAITLTDLTLVAFVSTGKNTVTNPTFAPNGLTAHTITKNGGLPLVAGDIGPAGYVGLLEYNLANTRWELLNPVNPLVLPYAARVLSGCGTTLNATTPTLKIDIAAGYCCDNNGKPYNNAGLTKTLNVAWAQGTGGGLAGVSPTVSASTWYYIWMIVNAAGVTDYIIDKASVGNANTNMPSGWTKVCLVWAILTDASSLIKSYTQVEDDCFWTTAVTDFNSTPPAIGTLTTISTPIGLSVIANLNCNYITPNPSAGLHAGVYSPFEANGFPNFGAGNASGQFESVARLYVRTDTSSQVKRIATNANGVLTIVTMGWTYRRGVSQ